MCIHLWRRSLRAGLKHRRCRCDTCRVGHTEEQADRRRHPSRKRASASLGRSTRSSSAIDSCSARAARRPVPQVGRGRGPQAGPPRPGRSAQRIQVLRRRADTLAGSRGFFIALDVCCATSSDGWQKARRQCTIGSALRQQHINWQHWPGTWATP